jgi:hypothetical protein
MSDGLGLKGSQVDDFFVLETHASCARSGEWQVRGNEIARSLSSSPPSSLLAQLFLPEGYPESVRAGYARYQIWDLIQGLSTYLRGALVMKELLRGLGVGDAKASAAAGAVGWIIRDGAGMVGSLVFSWWAATDFDRNVRQWRLFADVMSDLGLTLNMIAPLFGRRVFLLTTVCGSIVSSMCGVAAGATKAAVSQWFAKSGNLADCVAKEGTQESAVNILGLLGGLVLCFNSDYKLIVWTVFISLTALHLVANMYAVSSLQFNSINDYRFNILFERYFLDQEKMSVQAVADAEPWLPSWRQSEILMGHNLNKVIGCSHAAVARSMRIARRSGSNYAIVPSEESGNFVYVVLHPKVTAREMIEARFFAECMRTGRPVDECQWLAFQHALESNGWGIDESLLSSQLWRYEWSLERIKDR